MANLGKKNGIYVARFRHGGKEYKRSLKTKNKVDAEGALLEIQRVIHRLTVGMLRVPNGVDPGDFIVNGGMLAAPGPRTQAVPNFERVSQDFLANLAHLAESNRYTIGVHLRNLAKKLGVKADKPIDRIERRDLEAFLQARLKERSPTTVNKERSTVTQLFAWAVAQGHISTSPAVGLTQIKTAGELPPFRTQGEIEAILARGGLEKGEVWDLWGSIYLNPKQVGGVLELILTRAGLALSYILHALPAYSGMRRGELLRLRWSDIEFEQDGLVARSKKQRRQAVETRRRIDLHPELKAILLEWQQRRPRGQYVISDGDSLAPLTPREANRWFWLPLRGTEWCLSSRRNRFKIGFHTYRHSFASNLAAAGVDQRIIDEFMGHTTKAMQRRYGHLFPSNRRSAIASFSLTPSGEAEMAPSAPISEMQVPVNGKTGGSNE